MWKCNKSGGKNVWTNDALVTENRYVDDLSESGSEVQKHTYNVSAVYAQGESSLSNPFEVSATGIMGANTGGITVKTGKRVISVEGADNVIVYGADGKIYGIGHGKKVIEVTPGVYIVKADGNVTKVNVH